MPWSEVVAAAREAEALETEGGIGATHALLAAIRAVLVGEES